MSKITSQKAQQIKAGIAAGTLNQPALAKKFSVSRSAVSDIATGRAHKDVPWPDGYVPKPNRAGGQRNPLADEDTMEARILELESDVIHLTEERNREKAKNKLGAKSHGLFRAMVAEAERLIVPYTALPPAYRIGKKAGRIKEHLVMHLSDGHHDQVILPSECCGLEEYNFPISCARAERYIDSVIEFSQDTLAPKYDFTDLWVLAYGDHTSGEIHGHAQRSYYRNQFRNSYAIGQLHSLMIRDLAPHFGRVHVVYLPGNHGRRSTTKDFHGAHDNWDYLIAELARIECKGLENVEFLIPDAFSCNLDINGVGFNISHGDDVRGNAGIPFYGMVRRQKNLIALNALRKGPAIRYFCMGHHHVAATLSDINGELLVNGAWPGTDSYAFNSFSGYREPAQWIHGVNPKHGITWRLKVGLRTPKEKAGPKRYLIDGGRDVGPIDVRAAA